MVGALKIIVRACPDLACCVNPEQRLTLFVSVGLESSIQPDPGFYLLEMQIEPEGWLAGLHHPCLPEETTGDTQDRGIGKVDYPSYRESSNLPHMTSTGGPPSS